MKGTRTLYPLLGTILFLISEGCDPWEREEVARLISPDSAVDAVLARANGGATTEYIYEVYVVPTGAELPKSEYIKFAADRVDSLQIRWRDPRFLEISYEHARVHKFKNHAHLFEIPNPEYVVELRLMPLDSSTSLATRDR